MTRWTQRINRNSQAKQRGRGISAITILENTQVALAVACGRLNEQQAMAALRVDSETLDMIQTAALELAVLTAEELVAKEAPPPERSVRLTRVKTAAGAKIVKKTVGGSITRHVMR